jgi:AbrB family looped-hinge helix DNA binding protein
MGEDKNLGIIGPKFYGATTIGERGQMVIPAEARKDFQITPSSKLLVFGSQQGGGLMMVKAEYMTEFLTKATEMLKGIENVIKADKGIIPTGKSKEKVIK